MPSPFVQIHALTSYPASLLNRDDVGFAKRIPFGGTVRTRISSQCLKRHWRNATGKHSLTALDVPKTVRSRLTFDVHICQPLIAEGLAEDVVIDVAEALMNEVLGQSEKAKKKADDADKSERTVLKTSQITVLGQPEVAYLKDLVREICQQVTEPKKAADEFKVAWKAKGKEAKKNLQALRHASGLSAAMFGRMVTSDMLARGDAAVHVAHAFTVHEEASESDYFSAIDDLLGLDGEEALGSGHIGNVELTSGLYYSYVVVDVGLLVSNLTGCEQPDWQKEDPHLAAEVTRRLVHLVATVSPGAKLGSTAPYSYAQLVLLEAGEAQPRSLANAFLKPVRDRDLLQKSFDALATHAAEIDRMYGDPPSRFLSAMGPSDAFEHALKLHTQPLTDASAWLASQLGG